MKFEQNFKTWIFSKHLSKHKQFLKFVVLLFRYCLSSFPSIFLSLLHFIFFIKINELFLNHEPFLEFMNFSNLWIFLKFTNFVFKSMNFFACSGHSHGRHPCHIWTISDKVCKLWHVWPFIGPFYWEISKKYKNC